MSDIQIDESSFKPLNQTAAPTVAPAAAGQTVPSDTADSGSSVDASTFVPLASLPSTQTQPQSGVLPTGEIRAYQPPKSFLGRIAHWTDQVANDLKNGTDETGFGSLMKGLGAHGVYMGNPEAVADIMASIPLGLLKATKGSAEVTPKILGGPEGQTWQGIKDLVGGGLQAMTIPGQFVAPESALNPEIEARISALENRALEASGVTHVFHPDTGIVPVVKGIVKGEQVAQPAAQDALRAAAKVGGAQEGLSTVQPNSLRTLLHEPIDAIESKAKDAYRQIDAASGTDFRALNDKLANTNYELRNLTETEEDIAREAKLEKSRTAILDKIEAAKQSAIDGGVDAKLLDTADAQFKQAQALRDVEAKVFKNPSVVQGNSAMGTSETVNVDSAVKALQKLQDSEKYGAPRLEQAFGKDGANNLLKDLYAAQRVGQKALSHQQFAKMVGKWVARGATTAGAGALGYELLKP